MKRSTQLLNIICLLAFSNAFSSDSLSVNYSTEISNQSTLLVQIGPVYIYNNGRMTLLDNDVILKERHSKQLLTEAVDHFDSRRWKEAKISFNQYLIESKESDKNMHNVLYHLAKTNLNLGDYTSAANLYNQYLFNCPSIETNKQKAEWERALCYIQISEENAEDFLAIIASDNGHSHQNDAKGISQIFNK